MSTVPPTTLTKVIPQLLADITAQVATDPYADQTLVCVGAPGPYLPAMGVIAIAFEPIERELVPLAFTGDQAAGTFDESYIVPIQVQAWLGVSDPNSVAEAEQVFNRAMQLLVYVETAVRLDPSMNGGNPSLPDVVVQAKPMGSPIEPVEWTKDPLGRECQFKSLIGVLAQI